MDPIKNLLETHKACLETAEYTLRSLKRDAPHQLRAELSNAYARLETEHQRLARLTELSADDAFENERVQEPSIDIDVAVPEPLDLPDTSERDASMNELAASFAESIAAISEFPPPEKHEEPPRTLEGFPQPEDLGFEIDIGSEEHSSDGDDLMPAPPPTPEGPQMPASIDIDDPFTDDEPAPILAPPKAEQKPGWLDQVLRAYVDDDPLRAATIVANPRLKRHHCKDLEEVQLSGLLQRAPRTLEELTRLTNSDEQTVRALVERLVDKGLVEIR